MFLSPALVHGLDILSEVNDVYRHPSPTESCRVCRGAHLAEVHSAVFSAAARTVHTVLAGFAVFQVARGRLGGREEAWWDEKTGKGGGELDVLPNCDSILYYVGTVRHTLIVWSETWTCSRSRARQCDAVMANV